MPTYFRDKILKAAFRRINPIIYEKSQRQLNRYTGTNLPKILIYTDSRGFLINPPSKFRSPRGSYVEHLLQKYCVDYYLCKHNHTTIIDFLNDCGTVMDEYDIIILHAGIVDFSPRPLHDLKNLLTQKNPLLKKLNISFNLNQQLARGSFATKEIISQIISKLENKNIIYIGCNHVLNNWQGTYKRKRPDNMNIICELDKQMLTSLTSNINLQTWSDAEIQRYTVDNVHLSKLGFQKVIEGLDVEIERFIS